MYVIFHDYFHACQGESKKNKGFDPWTRRDMARGVRQLDYFRTFEQIRWVRFCRFGELI